MFMRLNFRLQFRIPNSLGQSVYDTGNGTWGKRL